MMNRQIHRNGIECIHGAFLHEECKDCRIEELEKQLERDQALIKGIARCCSMSVTNLLDITKNWR